jgi:quercetin dioxygenase-like cupin family protein
MLVRVPRLEILRLDAAAAPLGANGYATSHDASGVLASQLLAPDGYSLWVRVSELADGGELHWNGAQGEEAVYVISGALDVDGRRSPSDGAIIIESGVKTTARTLGRTTLVHFGPSDPTPPTAGRYGAPQTQGHGVHVVGPGGWFESGSREGTFARWYADSTCPTCRLCLLQVERSSARDGPTHHHSQDEIIYVIGGAVGLGGRWLEPGSALFIGADARYRIRTGSRGYRFLNYRRDVSEQVYAESDPPMLETALARGGREVGDLH